MITTLGSIYCVSLQSAICGMIESMKRADERQAIANKLRVSLEELDSILDYSCNNQFYTYETLQQLTEFLDELAAKEDISSLKKQIKYCKNPMQKKQLEKKLNEAYKKKRVNQNVV